jgi:hypothetical protein
LQPRKLGGFGLVQAQKREFKSLGGSAHMCKYIVSCAALQDKPVAVTQPLSYISALKDGALRKLG